MSNHGTVEMKVAFVEGLERQGETWEDRLEEARKLREDLHDVFGPHCPEEATEAEYEQERHEPEELEIEGVKACVFWLVVESYRTPNETLIELFRCLEKVPDHPPRVIANWKEYLWHTEFCRQWRCWIDLTWSSEASAYLDDREVFGPDGARLFKDRQNWIDVKDPDKGPDKPNLASDPSFEKVIGEKLHEYVLKWAATGGHLPKAPSE